MGGSPSVRAPEPQQMSGEERALLGQQTQALAKQNEILNTLWGQSQAGMPLQQDISQLQNMLQQQNLQNALGWQAPLTNQYNLQALQQQLQQQGLQGQLLNLQGQYAPQQYAAAQNLLGAQQRALGQQEYMSQPLLTELYGAGRGGTDLPIAGADMAWQQAFAPERQQQQLDLTRGYYGRAMNALTGNAPVDPALERNLQEQELALRGQMTKQLGPGWETSTPGIEALANFRKRAEEARYGVREAALGQAAGLYGGQAQTNLAQALGMQNLQQMQQQGMGQNLANRQAELQNVAARSGSIQDLLGMPFRQQIATPSLMAAGQIGGLMIPGQMSGSPSGIQFDPGAYGQLAQGYGGAASPFAQQRAQQYNAQMQANMANAQSGGSPWANLGMNVLGFGLGSFLGPLGGIAGGSLANSLFSGGGGGGGGGYPFGGMPFR